MLPLSRIEQVAKRLQWRRGRQDLLIDRLWHHLKESGVRNQRWETLKIIVVDHHAEVMIAEGVPHANLAVPRPWPHHWADLNYRTDRIRVFFLRAFKEQLLSLCLPSCISYLQPNIEVVSLGTWASQTKIRPSQEHDHTIGVYDFSTIMSSTLPVCPCNTCLRLPVYFREKIDSVPKALRWYVGVQDRTWSSHTLMVWSLEQLHISFPTWTILL